MVSSSGTYSNRRDRTALRRLGLATAFTFCAWVLASGAHDFARILAVRGLTQKASAECSARQSEADKSACQSAAAAMRSALAAEDAVNVAFWQTVLNLGGLVGLAFTVIYAKGAYDSSLMSARADNRALHLTRQSLREQRDDAVNARKDAVAQAKMSKDQFDLMDQTMQYTAASSYAMKDVARSMAESAKQVGASVAISKSVSESQRLFGRTQLRAYVAVLIGGAYFQDDTGVRFEARPSVVNTGHTFARDVRWRINAAVLPVPLPSDFRFPMGTVREGSTLIPPGQSVTISAIVDELIPPDEVKQAKSGMGLSLYVWGVLSYRDIFRRTHRTTFAQQLWWREVGRRAVNGAPDEIVEGWYLSQHNRAN